MKPTVIQRYPIPHNGEGSLHLFGPADATQLVIMCPGFPDDHRAFTPLAHRLSQEPSCLVGVICLPGYEYCCDSDTSMKINRAPDGYSFEDWVASLREAVKTLLTYSSKPRSSVKLTGVFHDWGVTCGLQYANQLSEEAAKDLTLDQIVILDVLPMPHPTTLGSLHTFEPQPWIEAFSIYSYQLALARMSVRESYLIRDASLCPESNSYYVIRHQTLISMSHNLINSYMLTQISY